MSAATKRARLQAAIDHVLKRLGEKATATTIIQELTQEHRATFKTHSDTNVLRVAGVQATCTWSKDQGLLEAWRRNAMLRIMRDAA